MIGWIAFILVAAAALWLDVQLRKKQEIDKAELDDFNYQLAECDKQLCVKQKELEAAESQCNFYTSKARETQREIDRLNIQSNAAIERYNNSLRDRTQELEDYIEAQKRRRREILDADLAQEEKQRRELLNATMREMTAQSQKRINDATQEADAKIEELNAHIAEVVQQNNDAVARYESVIEVARKIELEQQERLYYTIQVPEEYRDDIDFLITTVSQKVQHPDVINKLVWTEYIKPYLDDTFKRVGIEDKPGIYKITNINDQKAYIGKSTNIKKRISDHMKSSCGINTIADQAVHHAIWKTGIWNWAIEPVIYCDKDKLNEMEKYYIEAFKTQEYGFNRNSGGGG